MDYVIVTILFIIGFGYFVMGKISKTKKDFPQFPFSVVWKTFFREEWNSILTSFLTLALQLMIIFIPRYNGYQLPEWYENIGMYILAITLGYAGTRLAYKYLGSFEDVLNQKADQIKVQTGVDVKKELPTE